MLCHILLHRAIKHIKSVIPQQNRNTDGIRTITVANLLTLHTVEITPIILSADSCGHITLKADRQLLPV